MHMQNIKVTMYKWAIKYFLAIDRDEGINDCVLMITDSENLGYSANINV